MEQTTKPYRPASPANTLPGPRTLPLLGVGLEFRRNTLTTLTAEQLDGWSQAATRATPVDLAIELMRVTERIAARTLFSAEVGVNVDAVTHSITSIFAYLNAQSNRVVKMPAWFRTRGRQTYQIALDQLNSLVYSIINSRRRSDAPHDDLLAMLLEARDEEIGTLLSTKPSASIRRPG